MTLIGNFQLFAEPYIMTRGGPSNRTLSVVLYMYDAGFPLVEPRLRRGARLRPVRASSGVVSLLIAAGRAAEPEAA